MVVARRAAGALCLLALAACDHKLASVGESPPPAPSVSVASIGLALDTCDDVNACAARCDAGVADRCRALAATYETGSGVDKDETRATSLYERACTLNDASACVFAGRMYEYAHGVNKDDTRATRLYERACDMNWVGGCYNLAIMLEHGRGVAPDRARAAELYQHACTAGASPACAKVKELHEAPRLFDASFD